MKSNDQMLFKQAKNAVKKPIRIRMKSVRMELAVWMGFFGLGIAYFVWAIFMSFR